MPQILITNDDGYRSDGLMALADAMRALGAVTIVAGGNGTGPGGATTYGVSEVAAAVLHWGFRFRHALAWRPRNPAGRRGSEPPSGILRVVH